LTVDYSQIMLVFMVLAPGVIFGVLGLLWLADWVPPERFISRVTGMTFSASILALAAILWRLEVTGTPTVVVTFGNWFAVHEYHFPLVLMADRLSLPFLGMTVFLRSEERRVGKECRAWWLS